MCFYERFAVLWPHKLHGTGAKKPSEQTANAFEIDISVGWLVSSLKVDVIGFWFYGCCLFHSWQVHGSLVSSAFGLVSSGLMQGCWLTFTAGQDHTHGFWGRAKPMYPKTKM